MTTGEKIKELRNNNGLTQKDLGEMLGYKGKNPGWTISHWEKDSNVVPQDKLEDLCMIFNVPINELSNDEEIKFNKGQNIEGYPDPTADKAIRNAAQDTIRSSRDLTVLYPGTVYGVNVGTDNKDVMIAILCLNWDDDYIYGLPVYRPDETPVGITSHMYKITGFYVDIRSLRNFRKKRVIKELFNLDNHKELMAVKRATASKLGLPCDGEQKVVEKIVEVPVDKVVEKIVEVPVEAKEISNIIEETTFKLLKQRAEIYEDICNKLLASRGGVVS